MTKEKDVHVTNNINIKVDGEKKKKKSVAFKLKRILINNVVLNKLTNIAV